MSKEMKPDYEDYDFIHLGVSGGKDSTAVFLWAVFESGIPKEKLKVTFCDTGNEDSLTYEYINKLGELHKIHTIYPDKDFYELAYSKSRFPSARARFCTQSLKVIPSLKHIVSMCENGNVLLLSGIRKVEGTKQNGRGELPVFGVNESFGLDQYLPIYKFDLDMIWKIHRQYLPAEMSINLIKSDMRLSEEHKHELELKLSEHGIPRNPLYDMGAVRVGCFPCIHSRKAEIRAMAKYRPDRIDFIRAHEVGIGKMRTDKGSKTDYSSMFARNTVPEAFRTREIITKKGEAMMIATIDDVVNWSKTAYGGKQYDFDFDMPPIVCDYRGACE